MDGKEYYVPLLTFQQYVTVFFFFFSSRRRHTRSDRDWSSDVCSSDLKRPLGPLVALDLRVDRIGELAIVGEARQRIAHRQLPQPLLHLRALGHEGGERERHHRRDAHERLQQEERLVARRAHERTEPVQRPPDRDPRQHHDRARGLALREPERGPDKERKAQKLERIILDARWEQPTEHREAHYDHPEQLRRSLDPLGTTPPQAGGRRPPPRSEEHTSQLQS